MDQDYEAALQLSHQLNANMGQNVVAPSTTRETRASKKARISDSPAALSPEPMSLTETTVSDALSSLLLSPSPTGSSPEAPSSQEDLMHSQSPTGTASSSFSTPTSSYDNTNTSMVVTEEDWFLVQKQGGQNSDGTWDRESLVTTNMNTSPEKAVRVTRSASRELQRTSVAHQINISDDGIPGSEQEQPQKMRVRKRETDDDDDFLFDDKQSSPDLMEGIQGTSDHKPTQKRKAMAKMTSKIAKKSKAPLYHENVQDGKPEPVGQPIVWAFKRQQLCETLPYYNAYQSGAYTHDNIARSILIDKEVSVRDKFDEEIVITSVGGGRLLDEKTGRMVYKKDQIFSSIANAFLRAMELKSPVAIIAGQGNKISPSKLPHYYNVLDWFHVTDVWQEKVLGHNDVRVIIWKVRMEKINLSNRSWWAAQNSSPQNLEERMTTDKHVCGECNVESKVMYNVGPACLNVSCGQFFNFGVEYDDNTLDYHPAFLKERTIFLGNDPGPLAPPPLTDDELNRIGALGYEKLCKRGMVCQTCGCCIRRIQWGQWSCENTDCDYTYRVQQLPVPISTVIANDMDHDDQPEDENRKVHGGIICHQSIVGSYDLQTFALPNENGGIAGSIRHFKANGLINQQRDGPNDLFQEIQGSDLDLRRGAAVHKGTTQEVLTNHFTQNLGAAYKYLVAQDSKGFNEAPPVVIKAAKRMIWAGQHAVNDKNTVHHTEGFQNFNECLVIGYFDGSKIGYHDDGEKTLGPTVATLSLGANAVMKFRPKHKTHIPAFEEDPKIKDKKEKPAVLTITLKHGDIVVMHGRSIQKLYEHEVIPYGGLRFALTCRYIVPDTLSPIERLVAADKGAFPPGSERFNYNGSLHAIPLSSIPGQNSLQDTLNEIKAKHQVGELDTPQLEMLLRDLGEYYVSIAGSA